MKNITQCSPNKSAGFTIVELMLTLVILSIVLGIGLPNFMEFIKNNRLISQINQTTSMLAFARSEAAKRPNTTITLCGSSNTTDATPACNTSNWESGWIIFDDQDSDRVIDASDQLLQVGNPLAGGNTLRSSGFTNSGYVQFDADGTPDSQGTLTLCDDRGTSKAKAVIISIAGQTRLASDQDGDDIVNNHSGSGSNVTCP